MPRWAGSLFDDDPVEFRRTVLWSDGRAFERPWTARPFSLTVRAVCAQCNNGWMSDLEQAARPLLEPLIHERPTRLDAVGQHTLAVWAFKTMLMIRLASGEAASPEIDSAEYESVFRHRTLPAGEQVWLAGYAGEGQWPVTFNYWAACIAPPDADLPDVPNAHCCSFAVGHVAFALMGHRLTEAPQAVQGSPAGTWLPVWPAMGDEVEFPPRLVLAGDAEMQRFGMPAEWRAA